jgi:hypothetical protein
VVVLQTVIVQCLLEERIEIIKYLNLLKDYDASGDIGEISVFE